MPVSPDLKKIIQLLSDGQFHSGTELAKEIDVSRSTICKYVNSLSGLGIEFNAVTGKGYRLTRACQLLSKSNITKHLNDLSHSLIKEIEIHNCINSTNNYLFDKSQLKHDAQYLKNNGLVCFAEHQTEGKGRQGKSWVSPFASNIYLSILWRFQNGPTGINGLSLAIGVAVIRALNACGVYDIGLKWPNDILWKGKKLAGILIEVSGESNGLSYAVIGLGLNFYLSNNQAKPITQDWTDLSQILSYNPAKMRNRLAVSLLNHLMPTIANFEKDTLDSYLESWRQYDCMKGKKADIYRGEQKFTGIIDGIDDNGLLLLMNKQKTIKKFASGEISFHKP